MPKRMRRRLLTPNRKKLNAAKQTVNYEIEKAISEEKEVSTPRGRLKGALKDALEPGYESDASTNLLTPMKRNTRAQSTPETSSEEEDKPRGRHQSPQRYVLKLFDRSVDLSQFEEDSPLYPICRAWIANQPRMNYKKFGKKKYRPPRHTEDSVDLPGPVGPPISKIPALLPEQQERCKDNINLNYSESEAPSRADLLDSHCARWVRVRRAWIEQAASVEARYDATQQLLNKISVNAL